MNHAALTVLLLSVTLAGVPARADEIHDTAQRGDLEKVRALVAGDPSRLTAKGPGGMLPLHFAAMGGHVPVVAFLLDRGADPNSRSIVEWTPVHMASRFNRRPAVELLLARGGELEARDRGGATPLMAAADAGHGDMIRFLLGRGADPFRRDTGGASAFDRMCAGRMWDLVKEQLTADRERLKGEPGSTALHAAAASGNGALAGELMALGADRRARSTAGDTLLISAARGGLADLARTLLEQGEDPTATNAVGRSAVHYAVLANASAVVELLGRKGVDLSVRGSDGRSALDVADDNGLSAIAAQLEKLGAKRVPRPVHRLGSDPGGGRSRVEITYLANEGFLVESGRARVMVDAPNRHRLAGVSDALLERILARQAPFENVPVLLFSHDHADHFDAGTAATFLQRHPETWMAGNALVVDGLIAQDKAASDAVRKRVVRMEPEWGRSLVQRVNGVEITAFALYHDIPERAYKTCAFLFEVGGIKVLHVGDSLPDANIEAFRAFGLEKASIDIAFVDPGLLASAAGRTIVEQFIKPRAVILMHMLPTDVERHLRDLGPGTPNLFAFREPMEKQFFAR